MSSNLSPRAQKLKSIVALIEQASNTVIDQWALEDSQNASAPSKETTVGGDKGPKLASKELYDARRTILAATGALTEVVDEPQTLLMKMSTLFYESRALHIAAEHRIPDILAEAPSPETGVHIDEIAKKIGLDSVKLARLLRTLCTVHVIREVKPDYYANNQVSEALVGNEGLRANIMMQSMDPYASTNVLPDYLKDPVKGASTSVTSAPFHDARNTSLPYWEWLEQPIELPDGSKGPRPQLPVFGKAMMGGGRVFSPPHVHDYPWANLGKATVVDIGGGVGGFCMDLARQYPDLSYVVQDRAPVVAQGKEVWTKTLPEVLETRVTLQAHDFFQVNPVKGAAVYFLRYILHDWEDDKCVDILKALKPSLSPESRIVVADLLVNTTYGCEDIASAPEPLLANYGYAARLTHHRDLTMMCIVNGRERTPDMFKALAERAGLVVRKFYDVRGIVGLIEIGLP